jgi:hypothetical protein
MATYAMCTHVHVPRTCTVHVHVPHICVGALSDLRAVKKQHFGTHHSPMEILSLNSSIA